MDELMTNDIEAPLTPEEQRQELIDDAVDHIRKEHAGEPQLLCAACMQYRALIAGISRKEWYS